MSAVIIAMISLVILATLIFPMLTQNIDGTAMFVFIVYGLLLMAVIIGVLVALNQRIREIDRNEEEEAKKY